LPLKILSTVYLSAINCGMLPRLLFYFASM
jgi:hypothetical protein